MARQPLLSIAMVSASALAYEVLLTRLFAIVQWHYLASTIISLALLGYGASGTALALGRRALIGRFRWLFPICLVLFGLTAPACFAVAQRLAVDPQELLWDPAQLGRLLGMFVLLSVPFFCAASGVGLALSARESRPARVYAADLLGAGSGALAVTGLLFVVFPENALRLVSMLGVLAGVLAAWELGWPRRRIAVAMACLALPLAAPVDWLEPRPSSYKPLPQSLRVPGARIVERMPSPLGVLSVLESPEIPLRHVPGLSLMARGELPAQLGLFTDAAAMTVIARFTGEREALAYLDQTTSAAPFHVRPPASVLVLGAGGGEAVLRAWLHAPAEDGEWMLTAVELDPRIVSQVFDRNAAFAGGLYSLSGVAVFTGDGRGYLAGHGGRYDLIMLELPGAAGGPGSREAYPYTVEALQSYLRHLRPGGYLAITGPLTLPPRGLVKLLATAIEALSGVGVARPGRRLAMLRGWQTGTLLIGADDIELAQIERLRAFGEARGFDMAWYPGMPADEANRWNRLPAPYYYDAMRAMLGPDREAYIRNYKFDIRPATDDRPYFFHFFRWRTLGEILALRGAGLSLLDTGYVLQVGTLFAACLASLGLIGLPLAVRWRAWSGVPFGRARVVGCFAGLGVGFLMVEIAFIQKLVLFLQHPVYAVSIALSAFLVFAGLGSAATPALTRRLGARIIPMGVAAIIVVGGLWALSLDRVLTALLAQPLTVKLWVAGAVVAPLGFSMGIPFPAALAALRRSAPDLVPWAWGINGCASVVSAVGAAVLVVHLGFRSVLVVALAAYAVAALSAIKGPERAGARSGQVSAGRPPAS